MYLVYVLIFWITKLNNTQKFSFYLTENNLLHYINTNIVILFRETIGGDLESYETNKCNLRAECRFYGPQTWRNI
jgi:hypothetical protein